jgi:transcriptional regulator of arginine metabolism
MKAFRQAQILELVERDQVHSQQELRSRLKKRGIDVTQATLSRDISELALVKRAADGAYARATQPAPPVVAPADSLRRQMSVLLRGIERVDQMLVLRTDPGQAQALGIAIDRTRLKEVAGTVAGDDTIFVLCRGRAAGEAAEEQFTDWMKGK